MREDFFRDLIRRGFSAEDTEKQLDVAIDWGRYGEPFDYDSDTGELVATEIAAALTSHLL
jgi:NitT/TauT family transport system ATP-binding protein